MRGLIVLAVVGALAGVLGERANAAPWCGTVADRDRPAVVAGYPIRVLYALSADAADHSAEVAPHIHSDTEAIVDWWAREDSSRSPRFDVAAFPCGAQADIGRIRIPRSADELADSVAAVEAIREVVGALPIPYYTKFLVYYDGPASGNICGRGGGSPNGFGVAVVFLGACAGYPTTGTAVHELLHAMGAVPRDAGSTGACPDDRAHVCDSSGDVMYPTIQAAPISSLQLDVGRNDYYGHEGTWPDLQESFWLHQNALGFASTVTIKGSGRVVSDVPGLDCTSSCRVEWDPRTLIHLEPTPAEGFRFVRWEGDDCEGDVECSLSLAQPRAVTALFAPARFRIGATVVGKGRVTSYPGGISCPGRCAASFLSYDPVELVARPAKGWRLAGWTGGCSGREISCFLTLSRAATVRAVFVRAPKR